MPAGTFHFNSNTPGWSSLGSGNGLRSVNYPLTFPQAFSNPPNVVVALNQFDVDHGRNARVAISAANVTTTGFSLVITTWADTVLYMIGGIWYAELQ